jgi:hypothetical protein
MIIIKKFKLMKAINECLELCKVEQEKIDEGVLCEVTKEQINEIIVPELNELLYLLKNNSLPRERSKRYLISFVMGLGYEKSF